MGVNGFAFTADAVAYSNDASKIFGAKKAFPDLYCVGNTVLPFDFQKPCGKNLS